VLKSSGIANKRNYDCNFFVTAAATPTSVVHVAAAAAASIIVTIVDNIAERQSIPLGEDTSSIPLIIWNPLITFPGRIKITFLS
jgi:hypothetical protein